MIVNQINFLNCINNKIFNILSTLDETVEYSIQQFKLISTFYESNNSKLQSKHIRQIDEFFVKVYLLFQKYTTENTSISNIEQSDRIKKLKNNLPTNLIYCTENSPKNRFLPLESFAFKVNYPYEPCLMKLPGVYVKDHRNKNFFEKIGIKSEFTLPMLNQKLNDLKKVHKDNELDFEAVSMCLKIIEEMSKLENETSLKPFVEKLDQFYLLDDTNVIRDIKQLCSRSEDSTLDLDLNELGLHFLHSSISVRKFGVKDFKSRYFAKIGEPFGQKEKLTERINDILKRYSSQFCIFKVNFENFKNYF